MVQQVQPDTFHDERPPAADVPRADGLPGWDMQDKDDPSKNTHLWIVDCAVDMLARMTGPYAAAAASLRTFLAANGSTLHQGLWDADHKAPYNDPVDGIPRYYSHFYDPD